MTIETLMIMLGFYLPLQIALQEGHGKEEFEAESRVRLEIKDQKGVLAVVGSVIQKLLAMLAFKN